VEENNFKTNSSKNKAAHAALFFLQQYILPAFVSNVFSPVLVATST
jgi:hypothetical protein